MQDLSDLTDDELLSSEPEDEAPNVMAQWLATPLYVREWLDDQRPEHIRPRDPVPVDAAWLVPLDGNHAKLLESQPTWVLEGLVWAGNDEQVKSAALIIRKRFSDDLWADAMKEAESLLNSERVQRFGTNWRAHRAAVLHREQQDNIRASYTY